MKQRRHDKYTSLYFDRHGKERCVFRHNGLTRQLPHPSAPGYKEGYHAAMAGSAVAKMERCEPRTIDDLLTHFYRSPSFLNAGLPRQRTVRGILESFRSRYGSVKVDSFQFDDIERILVAKSRKRQSGTRTVGGKVAAKSLQKQLRRLFKMALKLKWIQINPVDLAEGVKQVKGGGYYSWNEEDIAAYRATHPLGTKARLCCEIALWTWARRGDVSTFGPKQLKDGKITYTQAKGGKVLRLPAAPLLLAAIKAMPAVGLETFLVTQYGKPFTKEGLGNKMREWCDQAGLPHCAMHGLRKAAARRAADLEASDSMLMAAGGWSNSSEVNTYTASANQERLALLTLQKLIEWDQ